MNRWVPLYGSASDKFIIYWKKKWKNERLKWNLHWFVSLISAALIRKCSVNGLIDAKDKTTNKQTSKCMLNTAKHNGSPKNIQIIFIHNNNNNTKSRHDVTLMRAFYEHFPHKANSIWFCKLCECIVAINGCSHYYYCYSIIMLQNECVRSDRKRHNSTNNRLFNCLGPFRVGRIEINSR